MANASASDKKKPHITNRRIKWRGANPPVYINPGEVNAEGKLIAFTLDHIEDAAYLTLIKRKTWHLATADELKNAVVLKSSGAEVSNDSNN